MTAALTGLGELVGVAATPPFNIDVPEAFHRTVGGLQAWQWAGIPLVLIGGALLALLFQWWALALGAKVARLTPFDWDDQLVTLGRGPVFLLLYSGAVAAGARALVLPPRGLTLADPLARTLFIVSVAWFVLRFLAIGAELVEKSMGRGPQDAVRLRGIQTQVAVLRRIAEILVWVVASALLLTQFAVVRSVGVSLLASAGIAGLVVGLAAQKSIATILAGIQLSLTQPIRIGDQVVLEGEFGEVEEIGLTYVVVKLWDLRRLVVPITYFLDRSFQNWSKNVDQILGTVTLHVDYTADIAAFRHELTRLLQTEGTTFWDGKVQAVQVTDSSDRTQTVRILLSAPTPGAAWDLRCLVRERMISFLQKNPQWIPRQRNETNMLEGKGAKDAAAQEPPHELKG